MGSRHSLPYRGSAAFVGSHAVPNTRSRVFLAYPDPLTPRHWVRYDLENPLTKALILHSALGGMSRSMVVMSRSCGWGWTARLVSAVH